jgi:hypothetical protein
VRRLAALAIYGAAMGWLEAVVVVYIRALLGMGPGEGMPSESEVMRRFAALPWLIATEQGRELATLLMIAAVAWLSTRRWRGRLGAFLVVFGVWDITYYVGLYAYLRWPVSLASMDLLFLIPPGPWWYQPIWLPIVISLGFIAVGSWLVVAGHEGSQLQA